MTHRTFDVLVSGGGIVGLAALRSLQLVSSAAVASATSPRRPLRIGLVDKLPRPHQQPREGSRKISSLVRTVALTPASSCILNSLGAWSALGTKHPYYRMAIRHEQANSPHKSAEETSSFMSSLLGSAKSTAPLLEFWNDSPFEAHRRRAFTDWIAAAHGRARVDLTSGGMRRRPHSVSILGWLPGHEA